MPLRRNGSVWREREEEKKKKEKKKRGVCDTAMYLAEERVSRGEAAFPRVAHSEGEDCSVSFKVPYIWCLLAAERANPAALC